MSRAASALAVTTAIQIAAAMAALALPAVAPAAALDLGVPASMVGTYLSLLYIGSSTAALAAGGLVPRFGAIRLSQVALGLCALGLLAGTGPWIALAALSALVIGLGYGPITPASSHVLARTVSPERRALTFSIKQTGVPAGTALAGLVVPPLAVAFGWPVGVGAAALLCLIVALAAQPLRAALDADRDRSARLSKASLAEGLRVVRASAGLRTMAAVSFVYAGVQMCVSGFIVAFLAEGVGLPLVTAGLGLSAANAAGVIARIAWGGVADRWLAPRTTLALIGMLMAVFSIVTAAIAPGWPVAAVLAACAALGATAIGWNGVYLSEVARIAGPARAGLATGGCLFFTFVGVVISPFLFGVLQRATGSYAVCFAAVAVLCAVTGAALWRRPTLD